LVGGVVGGVEWPVMLVSAHMSVLIMVFRGGLCCWPTLLAEVVIWSRHSPQRQSPAGPSAYLSVPLPTGGGAAGVRGGLVSDLAEERRMEW